MNFYLFFVCIDYYNIKISSSSAISALTSINFFEQGAMKLFLNGTIEITNVHIRFEDDNKDCGSLPFAFGIIVNHLFAESTNSRWEHGMKSEDSTTYKLVKLDCFSFYWDQCLLSHMSDTVILSNLSSMITALPSSEPLKYVLSPMSVVAKIKVSTPSNEQVKPIIDADIEVDNIVIHLSRDRIVPLMLFYLFLDSMVMNEEQKSRPFYGEIDFLTLKRVFNLEKEKQNLISKSQNNNDDDDQVITMKFISEYCVDYKFYPLTLKILKICKIQIHLLWRWAYKCVLAKVRKEKCFFQRDIFKERRENKKKYIKARKNLVKFLLDKGNEKIKIVDSSKGKAKEKKGGTDDATMKERLKHTYLEMYDLCMEKFLDAEYEKKLRVLKSTVLRYEKNLDLVGTDVIDITNTLSGNNCELGIFISEDLQKQIEVLEMDVFQSRKDTQKKMNELRVKEKELQKKEALGIMSGDEKKKYLLQEKQEEKIKIQKEKQEKEDETKRKKNEDVKQRYVTERDKFLNKVKSRVKIEKLKSNLVLSDEELKDMKLGMLITFFDKINSH
jgi:hypothetical protein